MSTREQGVDIVTRIRDETAAGAASTRGSLDSIQQSAKELNQQMRVFGDIGRVIRGGAIVGALAAATSDIERMSSRLVELRDRTSEVNMTAVEFAESWTAAIPVVGRVIEMGQNLFRSLHELYTGDEARARAARAVAVEIESQAKAAQMLRDALDGIEDVSITRQNDARQLIADTEALVGLNEQQTAEMRRQFEERDRANALVRRQAAELERVERAMQRAVESGMDSLTAMEQADRRRNELQRQHARELHLLETQFAAERAQMDADERERARIAAIDAAEDRIRMIEREAREADRRAERTVQMAGRLTGRQAGRLESGAVESFREQRIEEAERERRRQARETNTLLEAIRREIEQLQLPQVTSI